MNTGVWVTSKRAAAFALLGTAITYVALLVANLPIIMLTAFSALALIFVVVNFEVNRRLLKIVPVDCEENAFARMMIRRFGYLKARVVETPMWVLIVSVPFLLGYAWLGFTVLASGLPVSAWCLVNDCLALRECSQQEIRIVKMQVY